MAYLTMAEYNEMSLIKEENDLAFQQLLKKASSVLDNITRSFYVFNDLETDHVWRKTKFKEALGAQIEYFLQTGQSTSEGLNKSPQSQTIGRVSVTQTSRFSASGKNESKSIVCEEVYMYLEGTGLLNRGVGNGYTS